MRVVLVGADIEENLGVGMLAAVAARGGHQVAVVPFSEAAELDAVVARVMAGRPDVVGLSLQFQHRAREFLGLAQRLREQGLVAHVCCGGQFPSLAWRELLAVGYGLDSVALYDGEETFVALLEALDSGTSLSGVAGLALLDGDGVPYRTAPRPLVSDLDVLPFPQRYRPHSRQLGIPFIPLMGSRGCWGSCAFCSISSVYRQARSECGGAKVRRRSVADIADEMAGCCRAVGGPAVFCFHDDTFFSPKPTETLARTRALRAALDERGVGRVGLIGKGRPDSVTPELLRELRELGFLRLYIGVENGSPAGVDHLGRRTTVARAHEALAGCQRAGIFACYNLLIFEPWATLGHVRENVAFIRAHASHPVNFCRAEPYHGTPLQRRLADDDALRGSFLGFNYRIEDDATELLFRVCHVAFRQRNFDPQGVANRYMGLGYAAEVLEYFYDDSQGQRARLRRRADGLTRAITLETADLLDAAIVLVETFGDDHERLTREVALLSLRVARADAERHAQLDDLCGELERCAILLRQHDVASGRWLRRARGVVLSASVALAAVACDRCDCGPQVLDPPPPPIVEDPVPAPLDAGPPRVVDPPPPPIVEDPVPAPLDGGSPTIEDTRPRVHDPVPRPLDPSPPPVDPPPAPIAPFHADPIPPPMDQAPKPHKKAALEPGSPLGVSGFRDSGTRAVSRSTDLPLYAPPSIKLSTSRQGEEVVVEISSVGEPVSVRWEGDGEVEAQGRSARWRPRFPTDTLRVAIRTEGGVAVTCLRACEV